MASVKVAQSTSAWARPENSPNAYEEYDAYGNPLVGPVESKRDKRRRDMVDRVSRLHADTLERRERVFHDLSEIFARTADELLPPPVFPTFDLSIPVGQLPPSLPFTDPVIPDMHPTPYLFSLHRLSMERANQLLSIRLFHQHQLTSARRLFEAEVDRIEDEYDNATKGVVERLLEGVEERRKRLTEEKEGEGITLDTIFDPQSRAHGTRRVRGGSRMHSGRTNGHGSELAKDAGANGGASGAGLDTSAMSTLLGLGGITDPFNLAAALLPPGSGSTNGNGGGGLLGTPNGSSLALLSSLSGVGPTASILTGALLQSNSALNGVVSGSSIGGKRKAGGPRAQPGLPPPHFMVQSGSYSQFGKSLAGLSSLRGDEVEGDLGEVRRKRPRNAAGSSGGGGNSAGVATGSGNVGIGSGGGGGGGGRRRANAGGE